MTFLQKLEIEYRLNEIEKFRKSTKKHELIFRASIFFAGIVFLAWIILLVIS
jgi:hypothetical protein